VVARRRWVAEVSVALVLALYGCTLIVEGLLVLACLPWALAQRGVDAIP
jgi:hypothetical protein